MTEPKHLNTADIDWTKTDYRIAIDTGLNYMAVQSLRRTIFGLNASHTARWQERYAHMDFSKVDWANRSNGAIGKIFGIEPGVVRTIRIECGFPPNTSYFYSNKGIPKEELDKIDWEWTQDAEIGRRFHITRERVRQIRLIHQRPPCRVSHYSKLGMRRLNWARERIEEIKGKHINDVIAMYPYRKTMCFERKAWADINDMLGLGLLLEERRSLHKNKYELMDYRLPNRTLGFIWGVSAVLVGNYRHQRQKGAPRYTRRFRNSWPEELYPIAWDQIEAAKKFGREIDMIHTCQLLDIPTPPSKNIDTVITN